MFLFSPGSQHEVVIFLYQKFLTTSEIRINDVLNGGALVYNAREFVNVVDKELSRTLVTRFFVNKDEIVVQEDMHIQLETRTANLQGHKFSARELDVDMTERCQLFQVNGSVEFNV